MGGATATAALGLLKVGLLDSMKQQPICVTLSSPSLTGLTLDQYFHETQPPATCKRAHLDRPVDGVKGLTK
eukprot:754980-Pelagomonas_calceolata.AAC.3